jgi:hypothetical protein
VVPTYLAPTTSTSAKAKNVPKSNKAPARRMPVVRNGKVTRQAPSTVSPSGSSLFVEDIVRNIVRSAAHAEESSSGDHFKQVLPSHAPPNAASSWTLAIEEVSIAGSVVAAEPSSSDPFKQVLPSHAPPTAASSWTSAIADVDHNRNVVDSQLSSGDPFKQVLPSHAPPTAASSWTSAIADVDHNRNVVDSQLSSGAPEKPVFIAGSSILTKYPNVMAIRNLVGPKWRLFPAMHFSIRNSILSPCGQKKSAKLRNVFLQKPENAC